MLVVMDLLCLSLILVFSLSLTLRTFSPLPLPPPPPPLPLLVIAAAAVASFMTLSLKMDHRNGGKREKRVESDEIDKERGWLLASGWRLKICVNQKPTPHSHKERQGESQAAKSFGNKRMIAL